MEFATANGKPFPYNLAERWEKERMCDQLNFNMWELEQLFEKMGHRFAKKKADTIMFYANKDRNNCLD